ncbi:MAG: penM [Actinoallomurus sp.]|nr:penM [Actinoallomurus sp.]
MSNGLEARIRRLEGIHEIGRLRARYRRPLPADPLLPAYRPRSGHGAHYCLGAPLGRIGLQAVFSQLILWFPAMRVAVPTKQLRLRGDPPTGGLAELPVTW